ncbi:DUF2249 domain-containing protein [Thermomonospora catenispora]|uniref:DUF2249 domain-containing protein n=1 Tax=Thermomonospora catenispora TaxID=2493090 RepID=UPI001375C797|nr:DUF2249 domain-containing protein [Thermomonospora catenispora]
MTTAPHPPEDPPDGRPGEPPNDYAQQATMTAIRDHHARLARTVADHALTVRRSIDRLAPSAGPRAAMVDFLFAEVIPHALAEERTLYAAGAGLPGTRLLVEAMTGEHARLRELAGELREARTPGEVVGAAAALDALFQAHLEKENDLLLPALVEGGIALTGLLAGMHEILGEAAHTVSESRPCACDDHRVPAAAGGPEAAAAEEELDVRAVPHARRHERIFAAFRALAPGAALVLVNDHDPAPLRHQFAERFPGEYTWEYLEEGPQEWRVRIGRP